MDNLLLKRHHSSVDPPVHQSLYRNGANNNLLKPVAENSDFKITSYEKLNSAPAESECLLKPSKNDVEKEDCELLTNYSETGL